MPQSAVGQTSTPSATPSIPAAAGPTMKDVADVLQGKTTLLEQTDAGILTTTTLSGFGITANQIIPFNSSNSQLTEQPQVDAGVPGSSYSKQSVLTSSASGRLYNNGNDVVMSVSVDQYSCMGSDGLYISSWQYQYYNPVTGSRQHYCLQHALQSNGDTEFTKVVMGNFRGNNLVLPLIFVETVFGQNVLWQMNIIPIGGQVDVLDSSGGTVPTSGYDPAPNAHPLYNTIVAGDFNNDGVDEVAVLMSDFSTIQLYTVNPQTLALSPYPQPIKLPHPLLNGTLAAGRFLNNGNVYLAAVGQPGDASNNGMLMTVDLVDTQVQPAAITPTTFTVDDVNSGQFSQAFAQVAPIINFAGSNVQQLVLGLSYYYGSRHNIQVGSFDTNSAYHVQGEMGQDGCLFDMRVGNFNNQTPDTQVTGFPDNLNPNLQILQLTSDSSGSQCSAPYGNGYLHLEVSNLTVPAVVAANPQSTNSPAPTNWFTQASDSTPNLGPYSQLTNIQLLTGDFQGRSLRLGAPEKITLEGHIQPELVLGMPPMHVDWVNPQTLTDLCQGSSSGGRCIANLTAKPNGRSVDQTSAFTSDFSSVNNSATTTKHTSNSSWGVAVKTSLEAKLKYGQAKVATFSISGKLSAGYAYQNVQSQYDGSYSSSTNKLQTWTNFDDVLMFTTENQNIYNYPILGQTDQNGNPLYATYSVPSSVQEISGAGASQEWYQPVQEPGNVLSYPSSLTMLQNQNAPGTTDVKSNLRCFLLSDDTQYVDTTWVKGSTNGTSVGSTNQLSADDKASFTAKVTPSVLTEGEGGELDVSVDVSGSHGWGSLIESSNSTSSTNAVEVIQPRFIETSKFGYAYEPIVFGYPNAEQPYQSTQSLLPSGLNDTTSGPIYAGFAVNPVSQAPGLACGQPGGSWWSSVYTLPDVGFNHPTRWKVGTDNVATFRTFDSKRSAYNQRFYQMKGLFLTTDTDSTGEPGTPVGSVPDGQQVKITARVYNFSLVDTKASDPNSKVHVRFYGVQKCGNDFCPNTNFQIPVSASSADYVIDRIPGFNDASGSPNWTYATVNFNTTGRSGQNLVFWVVTWIEKADGTVLSEMPDHGITGTNFSNTAFSSISDVPIESHSNNVGLYGTFGAFAILPPVKSASSTTASLAVPTTVHASVTSHAISTSTDGHSLAGILLSLPSATVSLDEDTMLEAHLTAGTSNFGGSRITYYDGDPGQGGKLIDVQRLPPVAANASEAERVYFRPQTCGKRTIYAISDLEGYPATVGSLAAQVTLDPLVRLQTMEGYINAWALSSSVRSSLLSSLQSARDSFLFRSVGDGLAGVQAFQALVKQLVTADTASLKNQQDTLLLDVADIEACQNDLTVVPRAMPTLAFSASPSTVSTGQAVLLAVNLTAPQGSASVPTGLVQFSAGVTTNNIVLGSATLDANGAASLTTTSLPVGRNTVVAAYLGDTNFAPAVQTTVVQVNAVGTPAGDFSIATSMATGTIGRRGVLSVPISLSAQNGFSSPINFSCSGLPVDAACSFSPTAITPSGANSTVTMTITSGITNASAKKTGGFASTGAMAVVGLLGSGLLRRRKVLFRSLLGFVFLLCGLSLLSGCGSSGPQSPAGVYQITVTGSSGALTHSTFVALEVK